MTTIPSRGAPSSPAPGPASSGLARRGERAGRKPEVQASEYWANKGDVKLYLYRKRVAPRAGRDAAGAVPGARLVEFLALELRPRACPARANTR